MITAKEAAQTAQKHKNDYEVILSLIEKSIINESKKGKNLCCIFFTGFLSEETYNYIVSILIEKGFEVQKLSKTDVKILW